MHRNRLKQIRKSRKLSQKAVSAALNMHIRLYQFYEAGGKAPTVYTAIRIAHVLGTTVEELFPLEGEDDK